MKRTSLRILAVLMTLTLLFGLSACGADKPSAPAAAGSAAAPAGGGSPSEEQIVLKIGHGFAATHPVSTELENLAGRVAEASGGKVKIELYGAGVLGSNDQLVQQVISGSLNAMIAGAVDNFTSYNQLADVEDLPFLFGSEAEAQKALDGAYGDMLRTEVIDPIGVHTVCFWENGLRHITNNKKPLYSPADFKGIKFRSAVAPMFIKMFETLGASAVPIAMNELFTALQQGTVDGQENPLTNIESMSLFEVQKYVTLTGHVYVSSPVVFNAAVWDAYPEDVKALLTKEFEAGRDNERKLSAEMTASAQKNLEEKGMAFNELNDHEEFVNALKPVWDYYVEQNGEAGQKLISAATQG